MIQDLENENGSFSAEQAWSQAATAINEILEKVDSQCGSIHPSMANTDWVRAFMTDYLKLDMNGLEDNSIYNDPGLVGQDRVSFDYFINRFGELMDMNFGISFEEPDIHLYYCVYQLFCLNFTEYFLCYINGLQKLTIEYEEDFPNWKELSYEYFITNLYDGGNSIYTKVRNYLDYIFDQGLNIEEYIEVSLLESEGNVLLSAMYIELSNFRVNYDFIFLKNKIIKFATSDEINTVIIDNMVEFFDS